MDDLQKYHTESKMIDSSISHHLDEIKKTKVGLREHANKAIDLKCAISLRSAYLLKISPSTVLKDSKLPFINSMKLNPAKSINDIRILSPLRNDTIQFLNTLIKGIDDLPEMLASLDPSHLIECRSFIPEYFEPFSLFASSTLPALFGFCWTEEFTRAYINFLSKIAKNLPSSIYDNFRSHWLYDCYKNFIYRSKISKFLEPSLSGPLMELAKDETILAPLKSNNQSLLLNNLIKYADKMIQNMNDNIQLFPPEVSLLMRSFGDTADDEETRIQRYESLFIDCALVPAISFPKTYSLFPPTYNYLLDASGSSRAVQLLAQIFRLILHPSQAKLRYELDYQKLANLPFANLLRAIANPSEDHSNIKCNELLPLLEEKTMSLLFSVPDVYTLALAVRMSKTTPESLKLAKQLAPKYILDNMKLPLEYFRFETIHTNSYFEQSTESTAIKLQTAPITPVTQDATALFEFLRFAEIDSLAPKDAASFLEHHQRKAHLEGDFMKNTYLNNILRKLAEVSDSRQILPALEDELNRHRLFIAKCRDQITQIIVMINKISNKIKELGKQGKQLLPIMHSNLLESFLTSCPEVISEFREKKSFMLDDKEIFRNYLFCVEDKIVKFLGSSSDSFSEGVAAHFHTWMMQHLTLSEFKKIHPEFEKHDKIIANVNITGSNIIESVCFSQSPAKIKEIMNEKNYFVYVHQELFAAAAIELPVEAGTHIAMAIELITTIFSLSIGGMPQADDMTPILNFVLFTSGIPNLHSFASYLQHFYHDINRKEFKIVPDQVAIAITHIINHATSLSEIIGSI
ncbi:hypothetical protein TVAG_355150 [Trichomonas vaginalis G3]|uniref:VPS9 domain-containing protein n=1 Tax=Trichomonas vaginalis (strain ATCC PRA-98 / G3) TaxID=412133 RepID=A2EG00_TRIV3|nr:VPS9 domain family [Trichomonas vaginalis G3]EAY08456.1 hypothetical protein TVAG_355150 [Trichomonas vaginalis G3]KAI5518112.1 VPS9 domain family [Trichomonas vaginalis G3]|eukprot:XP_001320679.1 hypothetical protein [Trichomonas vaginalis G3]